MADTKVDDGHTGFGVNNHIVEVFSEDGEHDNKSITKNNFSRNYKERVVFVQGKIFPTSCLPNYTIKIKKHDVEVYLFVY